MPVPSMEFPPPPPEVRRFQAPSTWTPRSQGRPWIALEAAQTLHYMDDTVGLSAPHHSIATPGRALHQPRRSTPMSSPYQVTSLPIQSDAVAQAMRQLRSDTLWALFEQVCLKRM